jgi:two-component system, LuxR family, response regulator FixJ
MAPDPAVHVIDDDDAARDALTFLLRTDSFSVHAYDSAKAFLGALPAVEAGCVITDVRMPGMTGLELLRQLKTRGIEWPVIVMTGQADVPVAIEAIRAGAADFIEKPYPADVMLGAVRFALSGQANDIRVAQRLETQQKLAILSAHERQILDALVNGRSNEAVANDLGLNGHAIDVHRASVMTKMQATSLSHLVRIMLLASP